jgi:hypothetical protein
MKRRQDDYLNRMSSQGFTPTAIQTHYDDKATLREIGRLLREWRGYKTQGEPMSGKRTPLNVDPARAEPGYEAEFIVSTGILMHAELNGVDGVYDLTQLDRASLIEWLTWSPNRALNVVLALLGHSPCTRERDHDTPISGRALERAK